MKRLSTSFALFCLLICSIPVETYCQVSYSELLGCPTDQSVTINVITDQALLVYFQFGPSSGSYTNQTNNFLSEANVPLEVILDGLNPNTRYYYRMQYSSDGGTNWISRPEHSFITQRLPGSTYKFTVISDSHAMYNTQYAQAIENISNDQPDFHLDLGDTYMTDNMTSQTAVNNAYLAQRNPSYMGGIGHSVPIFLASGNHENEEGWNFDDPFSIALASIQARKMYYPTPVPDDFYTGNTDPLSAIDETVYGDELREDYYAWEWGDALFVVIDPFQYTMANPYGSMAGEGTDDPATGDRWNWTMGQQQFDWFKQTIESSNARYKFVFAHHMLGGTQSYVRGGAVPAHMFEWGGYNADGTTWGFETQRSGWGDDPIHQLMLDNRVSAFFHGHDHQYAYEVRDGIVYQSLPRPSTGLDFSYYNESNEYTERVLPSPGHLRVTVAPDVATVEYVSSSGSSASISHSYTIEPGVPPVTYDLTIQASPGDGGTTNPSTGTHSYSENSEINISAIPNTGYIFDEWTGDVTGTNNPVSVTMDGNRTITANFVAVPTYELTLAVEPPGSGSTNPAAGSHFYNENTVVDITASPAAGYVFDHWTGDVDDPNSASTSVTMDEIQSVTAYFTESPFGEVSADVNIILGRPTSNSITVNTIIDENGEAYFEYGEISGNYSAQTILQSVNAGAPLQTVIDGLNSNTQYFYRLVFQENGGVVWGAGEEHSFHTQRAQNENFTFTISSDSHLGDSFSGIDPGRYEQATMNIASDNPDFHLDLGDAFVMNDADNQADANSVYLAQRPYFGNFAHSSPVFLAVGNHENEEGWNLDDTPFSKALGSIIARKTYFPNPVPDAFYSGNSDVLPEIGGDQLREDYYAWEWGDALFIVLDPFQYTMIKPYAEDLFGENETTTGDQWDWTLGETQYNWFKQTLENSHAKFKFVFSHHMTGGIPYLNVSGVGPGYVRGSAEAAPYFEWGGNNADDTWGFDTERSGWENPVHQLMIENNVSAFFHGHDHQFVYEKIDDIVYQLVPSVSMTGYGFDLYDDSPFVVSGGNLPNAGHLRVTVNSGEATVEYVRSAISGDAATNGEVSYSYTIEPDVSTTYDLTIAASPSEGGTTTPAAGTHTYDENEVVSVSATPAAGYVFDSWTGDVTDPNSAGTTVTMDGNKTVTANFTATGGEGILGDVNGDNTVNSTDALIVLSCDVGIDISAFCPMNAGDVNDDGVVNSTDALIILSYDVGTSMTFPIGESGIPSEVTPCPGCN